MAPYPGTPGRLLSPWGWADSVALVTDTVVSIPALEEVPGGVC